MRWHNADLKQTAFSREVRAKRNLLRRKRLGEDMTCTRQQAEVTRSTFAQVHLLVLVPP